MYAKKSFYNFPLRHISLEKFNAKGFSSHSLPFFEKLSRALFIMQSADYGDIFCVSKVVIDYILENEKNVLFKFKYMRRFSTEISAVKSDKILLTSKISTKSISQGLITENFAFFYELTLWRPINSYRVVISRYI